MESPTWESTKPDLWVITYIYSLIGWITLWSLVESLNLVGGLVAIFGIFPEILGFCHHPNWRSPIFQDGVGIQPPTSIALSQIVSMVGKKFVGFWPPGDPKGCHRFHNMFPWSKGGHDLGSSLWETWLVSQIRFFPAEFVQFCFFLPRHYWAQKLNVFLRNIHPHDLSNISQCS